MRVHVTSQSANIGAAGMPQRANSPGARFSLGEPAALARSAVNLGISALANLDALMSLQEIDDPLERKKRKEQAVKRGHNILDSLNQLKASMLAGKMPATDLQRIVEHLRTRAPSADPQLDDILAQIELRAAVELAKLGMRP